MVIATSEKQWLKGTHVSQPKPDGRSRPAADDAQVSIVIRQGATKIRSLARILLFCSGAEK
jgi:hypothetical protein